MKVVKIDAFLASEPVLKHIPNKELRRLANCEDGKFYIENQQADNLRLELCRLQKFFSKTEKKKSHLEMEIKEFLFIQINLVHYLNGKMLF